MKQIYYINKKYCDDFEKLWDIDEAFIKSDIQNTSIITYTVDIAGHNIKNAQRLHLLKEKIISSNIKIKRVRDDSHLYFCNRLFPVIASIEDLLKDIAYVTYSVANKNINKDFDKKYLYDYFSLLIHDVKFNESVRKLFVGNKRYTKEQLLELISNIDENPIYQEVNLDVSDTNIIDKFDDVNKWRNNIMHFKPFTYNEYLNAKSFLPSYLDELKLLFNKLNNKATQSGLVAIMNKNAIAIGEILKEVANRIQPSTIAADAMLNAIKPHLSLPNDTYQSLQNSILAISNLWPNFNNDYERDDEDYNNNED